MAKLDFGKWEGTGNDFILVDDREQHFPAGELALIQRLCDRHLGIGSDGLILIGPGGDTDFRMEFFNPDGSRSFCGNGSRCAYACWSVLAGSRSPARFTAIDGVHTAEWRGSEVAVSLNRVASVRRESELVDFLDNGSPHELVWVEDPDRIELMVEGPKRRHASVRGTGGTNVNFIRSAGGVVHMRTYERGVEAETLSCGTGVVAAALSALSREKVIAPVKVMTRGGALHVDAQIDKHGHWDHIHLIGPVRHVFDGSIDIETFRVK